MFWFVAGYWNSSTFPGRNHYKMAHNMGGKLESSSSGETRILASRILFTWCQIYTIKLVCCCINYFSANTLTRRDHLRWYGSIFSSKLGFSKNMFLSCKYIKRYLVSAALKSDKCSLKMLFELIWIHWFVILVILNTI